MVREKALQGGGLVPPTAGEDHVYLGGCMEGKNNVIYTVNLSIVATPWDQTSWLH